MKTCPECDGEGVIEKGTDDEQRCPMCGGSGFVPDDDDEREEVIGLKERRCRSSARVSRRLPYFGGMAVLSIA